MAKTCEHRGQVAIIDQCDLIGPPDQHVAFVVQQDLLRGDRLARVGMWIALLEPADPWCVIKTDVDPLGAVLEEESAVFVTVVVSADESGQGWLVEPFAADEPVTPAVEP